MATTQIPTPLKQKLWKHQISAIQFALQRLRGPVLPQTGLLRMPTGTGKTGVIAVLSIATPPASWTLVLTPWANLCQQMIDDLSSRFWSLRGWMPSRIPPVERLYPSTLTDILNKTDTNLVVVGTFATLVTIFSQNRPQYTELAKRLSQVFVDEGHYEPAVEWGQAIKQLGRPTVLLTATPYRNDLKLFRVDKKDVLHYTHQDAEQSGIIRGVEFIQMAHSEPSHRQLTDWCKEFASFWKSTKRKALRNDARAIICCATMETVEKVTKLLRDEGLEALGLHEGFVGRNVRWLRQKTPDSRTSPFEVWVHQHKLTEGLDDSRFCVLAILNRIRNDRKLIQQIGRVLRTDSQGPAKAIILYSNGLTVERAWRNYRAFEIQSDIVDPERYRTLLRQMLGQQPAFEYFGGRFRKRFDTQSQSLPKELLLNSSCIVRRVRKTFAWDEFASFTSDFLLLEDCILLGPNGGPVSPSGNANLWLYAIFGNAPMLIEHSHYEIRLGALASVLHGDLLFITDTEGRYPTEYLVEHSGKIGADELGRIFGKRTIPKEVSLTNPWPAGPTVRRSLVYADNLTDTPAQLTDSVLVCGSARATVLPEKGQLNPRRQYLGFERGRVSEQLRSSERSEFSLTEFIEWTRELSSVIQASNRKLPKFFKRYQSKVMPPADGTPRYVILNLFEGEIELQDASQAPIEIVDSILELGAAAQSPKGFSNFDFSLTYRKQGAAEAKTAAGILLYQPSSSQYKIGGKDLNSKIVAVDGGNNDGIGLAKYLNQNDEAFAVALKQPDVFYTSQAFYQIDYTHAELRLGEMLTSRVDLGNSTSEKGDTGNRKTRWDNGSLFNIIDSRNGSSLISAEFPEAEFVFCDDMGTEVADFVCANFVKRRIAFIHAKHGANHGVSASALHEAVSQAIKNLSVISRTTERPHHINRWNRTSNWPSTSIKRWRKGANALSEREALWNKIRTDILNHPAGQKEVWLVLGRTLRKSELLDQLKDASRRTTVTGQVVHLLSNLLGQCTQLAVKLKVFCN